MEQIQQLLGSEKFKGNPAAVCLPDNELEIDIILLI